MENNEFKDLSSNHIYHTQIPNIVFHIGLKANSLALYLAIKRSAGDKGRCIKASKKLCQEAGIGTRNYPKIKADLCKVFPLICKPLIIDTPRLTKDGDKDTNLLEIVDIWPENMKFFVSGGTAKLQVPSAKLHARGVPAKMREGTAKLQHKEEPIKKNTRIDMIDCACEDEKNLFYKHKTKNVVSIQKDEIIDALSKNEELFTKQEILEAIQKFVKTNPEITTGNCLKYLEKIILKTRKEKYASTRTARNSNSQRTIPRSLRRELEKKSAEEFKRG